MTGKEASLMISGGGRICRPVSTKPRGVDNGLEDFLERQALVACSGAMNEEIGWEDAGSKRTGSLDTVCAANQALYGAEAKPRSKAKWLVGLYIALVASRVEFDPTTQTNPLRWRFGGKTDRKSTSDDELFHVANRMEESRNLPRTWSISRTEIKAVKGTRRFEDSSGIKIASARFLATARYVVNSAMVADCVGGGIVVVVQTRVVIVMDSHIKINLIPTFNCRLLDPSFSGLWSHKFRSINEDLGVWIRKPSPSILFDCASLDFAGILFTHGNTSTNRTLSLPTGKLAICRPSRVHIFLKQPPCPSKLRRLIVWDSQDSTNRTRVTRHRLETTRNQLEDRKSWLSGTASFMIKNSLESKTSKSGP
ncbi:hypothetical protein R3P38DRAFT_3465873 [Favolaschia claudopus]|uniref:Uncharacterized protein n=1 Tax=Favolaschia claudopus TaxID=2862362 RepID=A0AAV9ZEU2_9AGAR